MWEVGRQYSKELPDPTGLQSNSSEHGSQSLLLGFKRTCPIYQTADLISPLECPIITSTHNFQNQTGLFLLSKSTSPEASLISFNSTTFF